MTQRQAGPAKGYICVIQIGILCILVKSVVLIGLGAFYTVGMIEANTSRGAKHSASDEASTCSATSSIWLVWGFPGLEFAGTGAVYVNWHSELYHGKWRRVHIQRGIPAPFTESAKDMHIIGTAAMLRRILVIRCTLILLE
ncbi:hypothetical protein EGR_08677 [Echinococcus granulosus]|uniref:Uncharacterized protein n=1 Tax=Echinococcus granulosus TaxID=6210 RepID=W6U5S6_ECHGR|nr:hypothetical protein EGR_08677 [Echinococcus granulosus]EUB56455.1 hypothetical protein EGR_08677 [Echinococcus granulosus]